jgi:hypothetical protein
LSHLTHRKRCQRVNGERLSQSSTQPRHTSDAKSVKTMMNKTVERVKQWFTPAASIVLLAASIQAPTPSPTRSVLATSAAYQHLVQNWAGIRTMSSDLQVQTRKCGFPSISMTLRGHTYFEAPDKFATVFECVPGLLRRMLSDRPSIAAPAAWPNVYWATLVSDQNGKTTFRLIPKDPDLGLDHVDAIVNDATGLVDEYDFDGKNGTATTTYDTYANVSGYALIVSQTGVSLGRGYHAGVAASFTNYAINTQLPPNAFDK